MPNRYILRNYGDNCFFKDSPVKRYERYHSQNNYSIYNFYGCNNYIPTATCMPYNYGFSLNCGGGGFSLACGPFALSIGNNNFSFAVGPMQMSFGTGGCGLGFGNYSLGFGNYSSGLSNYYPGLNSYTNIPYYMPYTSTQTVTDYGITAEDRLLYGGGNDDKVGDDDDDKDQVGNEEGKHTCKCGDACKCKQVGNQNAEIDLAKVSADDVFNDGSNYNNSIKWVISNEEALKEFVLNDDNNINDTNLNKVLLALGFATDEIRDYNNSDKLTCLEFPNHYEPNKLKALKIISEITGYPIVFAKNDTDSGNVIDKYVIGNITNDEITENDNVVTFKIDCTSYGHKDFQYIYDATYNGDTLTLKKDNKEMTYTSASCATRNNETPYQSKNASS